MAQAGACSNDRNSIILASSFAAPAATKRPFTIKQEPFMLILSAASARSLIFAFTFTACAPLPGLRCQIGEQLAVHEQLYFGRGKPNGEVSAAEWTAFIDDEVTPRFPQGLTVIPAQGQWQGANGALQREATQLLHLIRPDDATSAKRIDELIAIYKARFQQESVLRVRSAACVAL